MTSRNGFVRGAIKVLDNGPSNQRWDLVILGDGYTADELGTYAEHVNGLIDTLLATRPFGELRQGINIHRVDVASSETGAGDLCHGRQRATYFASNFCAQDLERLLVTDINTAVDVATESVPKMNATLMMVNSTTYGGSGGAVPVFSVAPGAFGIALHEMGHSHFGLADEYPAKIDCREPGHDHYDGPEPGEPNVTKEVVPLKWAGLVTPGAPIPTMSNPDCSDCDTRPSPEEPGVVGAFEGAQYFRCGLFRPEFGCRMRDLSYPFCAVCQQTIRRVLTPFMPRRRLVRR